MIIIYRGSDNSVQSIIYCIIPEYICKQRTKRLLLLTKKSNQMKRKTEKKELKSLINKEGKSKIILRLTKNYLKNAYFDLEYSVIHEFFSLL